jgi:hypothetical protein
MWMVSPARPRRRRARTPIVAALIITAAMTSRYASSGQRMMARAAPVPDRTAMAR